MNKVILIGNVVRDIDLKVTPNGLSVCTFTLAVNRYFKDSEGKSDVDFIPVVAWRSLAENCSKYLKKGSKCAVYGEIRTRSYNTDSGKRYVTEIMANDVEFLSPKREKGLDDSGETEPDFSPISDGEDLPF